MRSASSIFISCSEAITVCVYCKSLPYTVVKKDWGHKGVLSHDTNTGAVTVDERAHLRMK